MRPPPSFVDHPLVRTSPRLPWWLQALLVYEFVGRFLLILAHLTGGLLFAYFGIGIFLLVLF
jgi:hypothetical protein